MNLESIFPFVPLIILLIIIIVPWSVNAKAVNTEKAFIRNEVAKINERLKDLEFKQQAIMKYQKTMIQEIKNKRTEF